MVIIYNRNYTTNKFCCVVKISNIDDVSSKD